MRYVWIVDQNRIRCCWRESNRTPVELFGVGRRTLISESSMPPLPGSRYPQWRRIMVRHDAAQPTIYDHHWVSAISSSPQCLDFGHRERHRRKQNLANPHSCSAGRWPRSGYIMALGKIGHRLSSLCRGESESAAQQFLKLHNMNRWVKSYTIFLVFDLCTTLACGLAHVAHAQSAFSNRMGAKGRIRVEMRHIDFRIDREVLFHIEEMHGELIPLENNRSPIFDDKRSFGIAIESGTIALSVASMASLLNNYVLAYKGAPISKVRLSTQNGELVQSATVHGIPVTILGDVSVTPDGLIRFAPQSIKMAGVPTKTLMDALGAQTERLVHLDESRGLKIVGDDMLMDINQFPTAPRIYGHLVGARFEADSLIETFAPRPHKSNGSSGALSPPVSSPSFMYFHGGVVRFGKLIMNNTDMEIVREHKQDWLDFDLDHYNDQLTAGCTATTRSFALISQVPNYSQVKEKLRLSK